MFYQLRFFDPSISDATISTQAGIIVGAKTAAQVCTGMLWGRLADSDWGGRKTVLMVGLLSSCMIRSFSIPVMVISLTPNLIGVVCIGYGLSRSFISAVLWQVFGGAMSSNVAIVRCVVAELNPEKRSVISQGCLISILAHEASDTGPERLCFYLSSPMRACSLDPSLAAFSV